MNRMIVIIEIIVFISIVFLKFIYKKNNEFMYVWVLNCIYVILFKC